MHRDRSVQSFTLVAATVGAAIVHPWSRQSVAQSTPPEGRLLGIREATSSTVSIKVWNPNGSLRRTSLPWDKDSVAVRGAVGGNVTFMLDGQRDGHEARWDQARRRWTLDGRECVAEQFRRLHAASRNRIRQDGQRRHHRRRCVAAPSSPSPATFALSGQ